MFSIRTIALAIAVAAFTLTSSFVSTAQAAKPIVFVSILPQKYFVQQIAGDTVDVEVMVSPGASPATYEPRPMQMAKLAQAKVYLAIGVPFERVWLPRFQEANPDLKIVHIDKGLRKLPMITSEEILKGNAREALLSDYRDEEEGDAAAYKKHEGHEDHAAHESHDDHDAHGHSEDAHAEHDHDHDKAAKAEADHTAHGHSHKGMMDPHVWLSPRWVKAMLKPMRLAITKVAPDHAKQYRINTRDFKKKLDILDEELNMMFTPIPLENRYFMTFHPSWGYFAMNYNLVQFPIEFEGKAPTPRILAEISNFAKERHLNTVFVQPQFSKESAEAVAQSIGAKVVSIDALAEDWQKNLLEVARKIAASFKQPE